MQIDYEVVGEYDMKHVLRKLLETKRFSVTKNPISLPTPLRQTFKLSRRGISGSTESEDGTWLMRAGRGRGPKLEWLTRTARRIGAI